MRHRGPISPKKARLSEDALAALDCGDVNRLMEVNRARFGGWTMMADSDEDDDDEEDDDDDDASGDDDAKKDKKKSTADSDADDDDDDADDEKERLRTRMKAADKRAAEAERQLQKIRDKDKSELERAQGQVTELEQKIKDLNESNSDLTLQIAFLTANDHEWHDAETALSLARSKKFLEDVVDEDGEVSKKEMKKALDRLAKEHTYLVKKSDDKKDDDEPDGPSGESASRRSDNTKDGKAKEAALKKRFPVLNR